MTIPLPALGSTDWYPWAQQTDALARVPALPEATTTPRTAALGTPSGLLGYTNRYALTGAVTEALPAVTDGAVLAFAVTAGSTASLTLTRNGTDYFGDGTSTSIVLAPGDYYLARGQVTGGQGRWRRVSAPLYSEQDTHNDVRYPAKSALAISPLDYGAVGDGATVDSAALQAALTAACTSGRPLDLGSRTYLAAGLVANGPVRVVGNNAVMRLPAATIINTDSSKANFTAILRVQGASWMHLSGITFDGNRDNQTYPATANTFGRGTRPWRHNAIVEITPGVDNTTPSQNVVITNCSFVNGYMNGLALWQCQHVSVTDCRFENNTWSGAVGAYLVHVVLDRIKGFRNGVSSVYTQARQDGDRATVQFREYDKTMTASTENMPTIPATNSQFNVGIRVFNVHSVQDAVEGVYLRACRDARVSSCRIVDPGYLRPTSASFYGGGIWFEWGSIQIDHNVVFAPSVVDTANYLQADGIVCYTFSGDGVESVAAEGTYVSTVHTNTICSGQEFPLASGVASDNANKKNNLYRGIRVNSNVVMRGNNIEGTSSYPIQVVNEVNFGSVLPINVQIDGGFIRNFLAQGAIYFVRGGSPMVAGGRIIVTNTRIEDGRNANVSLTANAMVLFDANFDGQVTDEVLITNNDWDCSNSAFTANPYMGVRHRGAATSQALKMTGNVIRGAYRAFYIAAGVNIEVNSNQAAGCAGLLHVVLSGNMGSLTCSNNTVTALSYGIAAFTFSGFTISRFVFVGNSVQGSGNIGFLNWTVGDANITTAVLAPNLIREPNSFDWRRTVTAAPTMNAWHVGEILNRSDGAPFAYVAVSVGSGAADWVPLVGSTATFGFPCTVDPTLIRGSDVQTLPANRAVYWRVQEGGSISKIGLHVTTSSGNICVGVHANSGTGRAAVPSTATATSGAIACPAAGYTEIALGATVSVSPGDWIALSVDNATVAFRSGLPGLSLSGLGAGRVYYRDTAFPLPTTPNSLTAITGYPIVAVGVA